ncbi:MAG: 30S ribosomal protein S6 [Candidatus Marinimicrobia bacterium]|nr:30S ribosomal protein S6 [Candidatus Neomarinimicrobiota bacterium]
MRYYENLFIVNPGYEDDALQSIKDEYANFITDNGGRIYNVEDWGKRRLAYVINKQKYGTYVLMEFGVDGAVIRELEESQRLNDAVLAQLTVRLDEEPDMTKEHKRYTDEDEDEEEETDSDEEAEDAEESDEEESEEADESDN